MPTNILKTMFTYSLEANHQSLDVSSLGLFEHLIKHTLLHRQRKVY